MNKIQSRWAKLVIFVLTAIASYLGIEGINPDIPGAVDAAVATLPATIVTVLAHLLHRAPPPQKPFRS